MAFMLAVLLGASAGAAVPDGYYNSLEGLSGVQLKAAVKNRARNHTVISYGDDTWDVFYESDTHVVGGTLVWWDMYSNKLVNANNGKGSLNIEHAVANSWWGGAKNDAYKDIFHLNPSDSEANNRKSNYPLGIVANQTWGNGVTFVGHPKSGTCGGANYVYEPIDEYKGDFARAFFYMFTIYDDIAWMNSSDRNYMYDTKSDLLLRPWAYEMLLEWAKNDPVSQKEIDRNEAIYKHQRNRNPFIDNPTLAEHIWGTKNTTPFHYGEDPDIDDPGTDPDNPDQPDTPDNPSNPLPSGLWYAVTSSADLNETDFYAIVSMTDKDNVAMAVNEGGKFYPVCTRTVSVDKSASPATIATMPDDVAVLSLAKSGSGWTVAVSSLDGKKLGYMNSTGEKSLTLTSSPSDGGATVSITPGSSSTEFAYYYGNTGTKYTIQYNDQAPRFTTYKSNQKPVQLFRLEAPKNGTTGMGTGTAETMEEVIIGIYDINGRKIAAESISELQNGLYIVVTNFGTKKILK